MTYSGLSVFSNSIQFYFSVNTTVHHLKFWEQTAQELIIPRDMEARELWAINWGNTISYIQASKSKLLLCSVILQVWLCTLCSLWFEGNYKLVPEPLQVRWDFLVKDKNLCWGIVFRQLGRLLGFHVCFALKSLALSHLSCAFHLHWRSNQNFCSDFLIYCCFLCHCCSWRHGFGA